MSSSPTAVAHTEPNAQVTEEAPSVPLPDAEAMKGASALCRPRRCFDLICSREGSAIAALKFRDDRTQSLEKRFSRAYEHIRCAYPPARSWPMKRLCSITRSRATGRGNDTSRDTNERDESARHHVEATEVEHDSQQNGSHEDDSRNATPNSADLEARVDFLATREQTTNDFARGCRTAEEIARENEKTAEDRAVEAEKRLAEIEAELYTLRAAQGTAAQGTMPGTSYALQAELARNRLNEASPDAAALDNPRDRDLTLQRCDSPSRAAVIPEVDAAASELPDAAANMTPLRDALAESEDDRTAAIVAQAGKALIAALSGQVKKHVVRDQPSNSVRPSDIGLVEFSGAHDKLATVIEPEFYPRLLLWLEESENLLRNSGLSTIDQIRLLIANLTGAARKQFLTRWHRRLNFATMTLADVRSKILALVPNHKTHFSRLAIDMTFRVSRLASDLDKFALYAVHGDLPVDGHHFWYRMTQDKLLDAAPDLFRLAAEHFGKRVEFEPNMKFTDMIDKFMDIVLSVQTELQTRLVGGKRGRSPSSAAGPSRPPKNPRVMTNGGRRNDLSDNFTLARKLGLCFGCGQLYPKGTDGRPYDRAAHDRGCRKKFVRGIVTDEFNVGIAKWRGLHDTGRYSEQALVELANSERRSLA
jgi:hypothetical protein